MFDYDDINKGKFIVTVFGILLIHFLSELIELPRFVISMKGVMLIHQLFYIYDILRKSVYTYESPLCFNVYVDSILSKKFGFIQQYNLI